MRKTEYHPGSDGFHDLYLGHGIYIHWLRNALSKTIRLDLILSQPLSKPENALGALVSRLGERGTVHLPTMQEVGRAIDHLYGAFLSTDVSVLGNRHLLNVSLEVLSELVASHDHALAASLAGDRDGLLNFLLSELVQPNLGQSQPLILRNYPLSQAALAKGSSDDAECAARFELFVQGIELANGYDELRDEKILLKRMHDIQRQRDIQMKKPIPMPTAEVLDSISRKLPQCTGVAMGVDRLHLVRSGKDRLDQVSIT